MMAKLQVKNGAWVLVCDGKKALMLRNEGDADLLNLRRAFVQEQDDPASRVQGTDAPGRAFSPSGASASVGQADWHTIGEQKFADQIASDLNKASLGHAFKELVVVAPAKTLAELRRVFSKEIQAKIAAELPKDLTHHTIPEIETLLAAQEV
jgi:protein required for attachment to host cells